MAKIGLVWSVLAVIASGVVHAQPADGVVGDLNCEFFSTGSGRVCRFSKTGEVLWENKTGNNADAWLLPNGNALFADGNVWEYSPDHQVVWSYKPQNQAGGGAYSCQRLANGNTLVGENSTTRILEVDPAGKIVFSLQLKSESKSNHHNLRMVRKLENGHYLVCHSGENRVREYDVNGAILWEKKVDGIAFAAVRASDGTTYISSLNQVEQYDPSGKVVWALKASELPDLNIRNMTGLQLLANGNLVIGCYSAYDKEGKGVGLFEVTREKKVVWTYVSPKRRDRSMMGFHLLNGEKVIRR